MTDINKPNINLQPHLGRMKDNYKPHTEAGGYLALAKVLKVHHKHGTADIQILKPGNIINSNVTNEGKFGARMSAVSAHYNPVLSSSSGVIQPIQEGEVVILAFLDSYKEQPVILGSFHETWEYTRNILPDIYPIDPSGSMDEMIEALKYLRVFPSQLYHRVDGIGGIEISHPSKTFLKIDADLYDELNDDHKGFDHQNLTEKDPITYNTRSGHTEETSLPVKSLFVHRSSFDDSATSWTKFFLDSDGLFRTTRDNNDGKLTYLELSKTGGYKIRRQNDSSVHGSGSNFTEIGMATDGGVKIVRNDGAESSIQIDSLSNIALNHKSGSSVTINGSEIRAVKGNSSIEIDNTNNIILKHDSGSTITMDGNGDILISAKRYVTISEGGTTV